MMNRLLYSFFGLLLASTSYAADLCPMVDNNPADDPPVVAPAIGGTQQVYRSCSPVWAYNNDTGRGVLINTIDYTQQIQTSPVWPGGTALVWNWPNTVQAGNAPYGFPALVYGAILGMNVGIYGPISTPINGFATLKVDVAATPIGAQYDSANTIVQVYVTSKANGLQADVVGDVQVMLHRSAFLPAGAPTYTAPYSGVGWDVWKTPTQVILVPKMRTDHLSISLDLLEILKDLSARTYFPNTSWVNGIQVGAQIIKGRGSVRFDKINFTWE